MKVLVAHVIITAYGFWLPNDPRGSWSDFVGAWELLRFGRATLSLMSNGIRSAKAFDRSDGDSLSGTRFDRVRSTPLPRLAVPRLRGAPAPAHFEIPHAEAPRRKE